MEGVARRGCAVHILRGRHPAAGAGAGDRGAEDVLHPAAHRAAGRARLRCRGGTAISHQLCWLAPHAFLRPRTRKAPRALYLGTGSRKDEEVYLELDLLENVHGVVVGPMGSGKSTAARTIALRALEKGLAPVFVDPSGEYGGFAERVGFEVIDLWDRQLDIGRNSPDDLRLAFSYAAPLSHIDYLLLRRRGACGLRGRCPSLALSTGSSPAAR